MNSEIKPTVYIPFEMLPEGQNWTIGKSYRVKLVLKQTGASEDSAQFEIVDATSLEAPDRGMRSFISDGGAYRA